MALDVKDKIKILLSLDNLLVPANTIDRNKIFFQLYKEYTDFFNDLKFKPIIGDYFQSDVLDGIIFDFHLSEYFETLRKQNKYYSILSAFKNQILNYYEKQMNENKDLFNKIKDEYIQLFNQIYPKL